MTDHRRHALGGAAAVDVSVATVHRTGHPAKVGARGVEERFTEGTTSTLVADEG